MASKKELDDFVDNLHPNETANVAEQESQENKEEQTQQQPEEECKCTKCQENFAKAEEYKKLLQITMADFDNYRKRNLALLQDAKSDGEINVIMKFLPALDSLSNAKNMISDKETLKGIQMIEKSIKDSLKSIGVKEIQAKGKKFDPEFHNAISVSYNNDLEEDIIVDVYQAGYTYQDKVIRYSQVIINKKGGEDKWKLLVLT